MPFNATELIRCVDNSTYMTFRTVASSISSVLTLFGNSLILVSIYKFRFLRTKTHIVIGNLAVADFLFGVCAIFPALKQATEGLIATQKYMCTAIFSLIVISLGCSISNLVIMSFERTMSLLFPMRHRIVFTKRKLYIMIAVSWISQIIYGLLPFFGLDKESTAGKEGSDCIFDFVWTGGYAIFLTVNLACGLVLNSVLYALVIFVVLRNVQSRKVAHGHHQRTYTLKNKTKLTLIIFGVFAICWTPYLVTEVWTLSSENATVTCVKQWLIFLGYVNSSINWTVYGVTNTKFRYAFYKLLKCDRLRRIGSQSSETSDNEESVTDVTVVNGSIRRSPSQTSGDIHMSIANSSV